MSRDIEERKHPRTRHDDDLEQQLPARPDPTAHVPLDLSEADVAGRRLPPTARTIPEPPMFGAGTGFERERLRPEDEEE